MSLARPDFESLTTADLQQLIDDGVSESSQIDYKAGAYGTADADKKEFLKDVSAFANSNGGHLLIGISETAGVPSALSGIPLDDADAEVLRLESLIRDGVEPRIVGVRTKAVGIGGNKYALAIRVPKSWAPPHRVCFKGTNRIWLRNSAGTHEASMEELRQLFGFGSNLSDQVRAFRTERARLLRAGEGPRKLSGRGQFILHIIPLASMMSPLQIDVAAVHQNHMQFRVFGDRGMSPRINFDGVIVTSGASDDTGYVQVFRSGIVEAAVGDLVFDAQTGQPCIAGMKLERELVQVLGKYIEGLRMLDIPAPLAISMTLQGVHDVIYAVEQHSYARRVFDREILELPVCYVEDYTSADAYVRSIQPALDTLWNAVGYMRNEYFNAQGQWVGKP